MARYSDDELGRLYEEAVKAAQSENDDEWQAVLGRIEKLEKADPWLRSHAYVTEHLGTFFLSVARETGRTIPHDCSENIAKLVLLFERPLVASVIFRAMVKNLDDPIDALEDAIRMAELKMNVTFTRLTEEQSENATVNRLVEYSGEVGDHLQETEARKLVKAMLEEAQKLRTRGLMFQDLGEYASKGFVERLQKRGLFTHQEFWYRDSIMFCLQMHTDPYLAAVTMLRMASRDSDPTEGLAELLKSAQELVASASGN